MTAMQTDVKAVTNALAAPFELSEVKFKPQSVKGNRALALAYIDCRVIQDRLDDVLGVENWQDEYQLLPDGSVACKLQLRIGGDWITKMDVGSMSEQPDGGDRLKAAFSDALKRAAVKFGIGRYLYRLPPTWADYDPAKKQFTQPPQLPAFARPKAKAAAGSAPTPAVQPQPAEKKALPQTGLELHERLKSRDAKLAGEQKCQIGDLLSYVAQAGVAKGYGEDITSWTTPAIEFATVAVKDFMANLKNTQHVGAA